MSTINIGEGMRFGMGVDKSSETVRGEAIVFDKIEHDTGGQRVDSDVVMIESQESLQEELNISVNASFQLAFSASGDLKTKLVQQHTVNDFSVYMLFKAVVVNPSAFMINPRLKDSASDIYKADPEQFRQLFGDAYIDTIISGGELFGLFIFTTHDESSQSDVSIDLNASIGNFLEGGEITAAFHNTIERATKRSNLEIKAIMSGGAGLQNPENLNDLAALHRTFNQAVFDHPIDYQATLKDFRFLPLPPGRSFIEQFVRKSQMEECGRRVVEAMKQRAQIEFILKNPAQFINPDENLLKDALQKLDALIPNLGQRATDCADAATDNVGTACSLADLQPVVVDLPARQKSTDPIGAKLEEVRMHHLELAEFFKIEDQPDNADLDTRSNGGQYMIFKGNSSGVFFRPDIDGGKAHISYGPIFQEYFNNGHCKGILGYPTNDPNSDDVRAPDLVQNFEFHGTIFLHGGSQTAKTFL